MNCDTVRLRSIKSSDYKYLAKIISDTWDYESLYTKKLAKQVGLLYLASNLIDQSYTTVAELNGIPVGVIMGKNLNIFHIEPRYNWLFYKTVFKLMFKKEGRKALRALLKFDEIDEKLLEETHKDYDGQLTLFIMDKKARGHGIGTSLYNNLLDYFRTTKVNNFYLFTDDDCNYQFYLNHDLHKEISMPLILPGDSTTCYIFAKDSIPKKKIKKFVEKKK